MSGRPRQPAPKTLPDDLFDYDNDPAPRKGVQRSGMPLLGPNGQTMRVTDDWPDDIPVTEAEIQVFERWFGDVFDELLSPEKPEGSLQILSQFDKKST
jgi:hypothetical protein